MRESQTISLQLFLHRQDGDKCLARMIAVGVADNKAMTVQVDKHFGTMQDGKEMEVQLADVGENKVRVFEGDNAHQDAVELSKVWYSDSINIPESGWTPESTAYGLSELERYFCQRPFPC